MSVDLVVAAGAALGLLAVVYLTGLVGAAWAVSLGIALSVFSSHWDRLGVPIGLDRILVAVGLAAALLRFGVERRRPPLRITGTHVVLLAAAGFAACSALWAGSLDEHVARFRLLDAFGVLPYIAFAFAPVVFRGERERRILLGVLVALGAYLGLTTFFESANVDPLVVPKYILDPNFGIHQNRARGPFVEAVANGLSLFMCAAAAAVASRMLATARARHVSAAVCALCLGVIPLTYTRSVWIGALAGTVAALAVIPGLRRWLLPTVGTAAAALWVAILVVPGLGGKLDARYRDEGPVEIRRNTNAAALHMLAAHPVAGIGWDRYVPYSYEHFRSVDDVPPLKGLGEPVHNVFLARAVELGIAGAGLWLLALLVGVGLAAISRPPPEMWAWRAGLVAVFAAWMSTGMFGPLDYAFPTLLLWTWAGVVAAPAMSLRRAPAAAPAV